MATAQYDEVFLAFEERPQVGSIRLNCTLEERHVISNTVTRAPVERGANRAHHIVSNPAVLAITAIVSDRPDNIIDQEVGAIPAFALALLPTFNLLNLSGQGGSPIGFPQARAIGIGDIQTAAEEDTGDPAGIPQSAINLAVSAGVAAATVAARAIIRRNRERAGTRGKYSYKDDFESAYARFEALNDSKTPFKVITALKTYRNMVIEELVVPEEDSSDLLLQIIFVEFDEVGVRRDQFLSEDFADEGSATDVTGNQAPIDLSAEVEDSLTVGSLP